MAYEKPELLILNLAGRSVRDLTDNNVSDTSKTNMLHEAGFNKDGAGGGNEADSVPSSSTSGAYEADE